jgi:hypothetical protein
MLEDSGIAFSRTASGVGRRALGMKLPGNPMKLIAREILSVVMLTSQNDGIWVALRSIRLREMRRIPLKTTRVRVTRLTWNGKAACRG